MDVSSLIESTLRSAEAIQELPLGQWDIARGIWTGRFSQGDLFPFIPEGLEPIDLVWIAENPAEWSEPDRAELYTSEKFNWKVYLDHFGSHQDIAHWRSVRKALGVIGHGRRLKVLFSNAYLFEWAGGKKSREQEVGQTFAKHQGPFFNALQAAGALSKGTRVCLAGKYAHAAWAQAASDFPRLSDLEVIPLGHPSRGHLAKSLRALG